MRLTTINQDNSFDTGIVQLDGTTASQDVLRLDVRGRTGSVLVCGTPAGMNLSGLRLKQSAVFSDPPMLVYGGTNSEWATGTPKTPVILPDANVYQTADGASFMIEIAIGGAAEIWIAVTPSASGQTIRLRGSAT